MTVTARMPTLYIPHGGGPCFFMRPPLPWPEHWWDGMAAYLKRIGASLGRRPDAVLVISSHWETPVPVFNVAAKPGLLFDYYGFPDYTYELTYPAPGAPAVAAAAKDLLEAAGFSTGTDETRGLDHGVFVPFKLIYPAADIPIVQLSLMEGLDPVRHFALGAALAPLREQNVLIVGSGMSYHNMQGMRSRAPDKPAERFDSWLAEAIADPAMRGEKLARWADAPGARDAHPREEHLLPLMVAAGAADGDAGRRNYHEFLGTKPISGFQFG